MVQCPRAIPMHASVYTSQNCSDLDNTLSDNSPKPNWSGQLNSQYRKKVPGISYSVGFLVFHPHEVCHGIQGFERDFTIYHDDPYKTLLPSISSRCCTVSCLDFKNILTDLNIYAVFYFKISYVFSK